MSWRTLYMLEMRRLAIVLIASLQVCLARADDTPAALTVIADTADRICGIVATQGGTHSSTVSGDVHAELSGLVRHLASIGVSGAGEIASSNYQNVLQQELPAALRDARACKLRVFERLVGTVLPGVIVPSGAGVPSGVTESQSASNDLESKATALHILSRTATDLCKDIPIYGEGTDVELTGEAKAEIDNLLKKVIDLKVGGAAKYISDEYKGVLRKDLAIVLKNSTDCKVEVLKLFHDDFFPPREESAIKPPSKPASGLPTPKPLPTFDGWYYSTEFRYGFQIRGSLGMATISNSPTYKPGDVILRFTINGEKKFKGEHICTDGNFYPVTGTSSPDGSLDMTIQGCSDSRPFRMMRTVEGYQPPVIPNEPLTQRTKYFKALFNSAIESGDILNVNVTIQNVYGAPFNLSAPFRPTPSRSLEDFGAANDNIGNIFRLQNVVGVAAGRCQRVRFSNEYNLVGAGATETVILTFVTQNAQNKGTSLTFSTNFCVETADSVGFVSVGFTNVPLR